MNAHKPLTAPISGILILSGETVVNYLGLTQTAVDPGASVIGYSVRLDSTKAQPREVDGWEHYTYVFTYRHQGRTFSITWRCGTLASTPIGHEGLEAAFLDAGTIAYERFGEGWALGLGMEWETPTDIRKAQRMYDACESTEHRLAAFFGKGREAWEEGLRED
jgi:hypothetical protein